MARHTHEDYVTRPFEGLTGETDWVALRDILGIAAARTATVADHGGREVIVATMLPNVAPAWHRQDGTILLGLQNHFSSDDASRDMAQALLAAIDAEPGTIISRIDIAADGPRLQDLIDPQVPFEAEVHDDFSFWIGEGDGEMREMVDNLKESADIAPTAAVAGLTSAYWTEFAKPFLRWVRTEEEEHLLDGLARLQAQRRNGIVDGSRYAGAFRACGLMIPVWELPEGTTSDDLVAPAPEFGARLEAALATRSDLTSDERRARAGLVARSVTLR